MSGDLSRPFNWTTFERCHDDTCDFCWSTEIDRDNHFAANLAVAALERARAEIDRRLEQFLEGEEPGLTIARNIIDGLLESRP